VYSVELNGAIRYIKHSLAGSDPTYTLGGAWQPIRDITLRGNYTRSVRSPAITEYFNPTSQIFTTANDPCDDQFIGSGANPATRAANCAADGLDPDFSSDIVDFTATGSLSGNANLINEKADAWTVGAVVRPRFLPGFTAAADWINIKVKDAVQSLSATNVLEACYDSPSFPDSTSASGTNFCSLFTRDADGQITFIRTGFENAANLRFKGLVAELAYRRKTPFLGAASSLELGINYLYNDTLTLQVGTSDITTLSTSIGYSRHQATGNLTYRNKGVSVQWQTQYFGKAKIDPDADENTYQFPTIKAVFLHNASVNYTINDQLRLNFVVDNVFDRKKPFQVPASGGTVTYFDAVRGRYFRIGAGFKF
jgi:outer membrane receptor protein involved in Fe transport